MKAVVAWWDLDGSGQTVASLREALQHDGVQEWAAVPGLVAKFWVSDPDGCRWGALMLFENGAPDRGDLPPNRAAELIGSPPTVRAEFDVEAVAEGPCLAVAPPERREGEVWA